jgi:type IV pilus assembly protein PilE
MRQKGFTLIELMIVVAVVAILAAIAIPSYLEQTRKGRRADALRSVGDMQLALERWRAENPSYANCGGAGCGSGTYPTFPTSLYYTITVPNAGVSTYTITATPAGTQQGDRCGNLSATASSKPDWSGDADCDH